MEIYELNNDINLNNISLDNPHSVQGGSFFTKILLDNKPLYFQLPKCSTKQGLVETKNISISIYFTTKIVKIY